MRRNGLMIFDALMGLMLLAVLATALAVAFNLRQKSAVHLSEQRKANQAAREALVNFQTAGEANCSDPAATVSLQPTTQRVGDRQWVEISVQRQGRLAMLFGLAPATQSSTSPKTAPVAE